MAKTEGFSIVDLRDIVDEATGRGFPSLRFSERKEDNRKFFTICNHLDHAKSVAKDKGIIKSVKAGPGGTPHEYSVGEVLGILGELTQITLQDSIRGRRLRAIPVTKETVTRAEEIVLYNAVGKNPPPKKRV